MDRAIASLDLELRHWTSAGFSLEFEMRRLDFGWASTGPMTSLDFDWTSAGPMSPLDFGWVSNGFELLRWISAGLPLDFEMRRLDLHWI